MIIVQASARHFVEKIISYETCFVLNPYNSSGFHILWLESINAFRAENGDAALPPSPTVRNPTAQRQIKARLANAVAAEGNAGVSAAAKIFDLALDEDEDLEDDLPEPHIPEDMSEEEKRELLLQFEQSSRTGSITSSAASLPARRRTRRTLTSKSTSPT